MNALVGIVVLLIVAGTGVAIVLFELLQQAEEEDPVGPWDGPRPRAPSRPPLPQHYLTMWAAEAGSWSRMPHEWERLVRHLDSIEVSLEGGPRTARAPAQFDERWLEQRLDQLERLARDGPGSNGGR